MQLPDGSIRLNRELCCNCGECVAVCPSGARVISGKTMSLGEVMEAIRKDEMFYRNSGGGLTASGGEPTQQPEFLKQLFRACRNYGIHTTLDTSGYVPWPVLKDILKHVNLVYYDVKDLKPQIHWRLTGVDNYLILDNAKRISQSGVPMVIRLPMIPGYNDSTENIKEVASFVTSLKVEGVDILPFHTLGRKKYDHMGIAYHLGDLKSYTGEEVARLVKTFGDLGLKVNVA
jgi:pyruvate formate lyase activating enzyme